MITSHPLTPEQFTAWESHVLQEFPREACAYLAGVVIVPVKNISPTPNETFAVNPIERMKAEAEFGEVTGFLHSHPVSLREAGTRPYPVEWPSGLDMQSWIADDVRWGISACDGEVVSEPIWMDEDYIAPLEGRPFIHGIWDCYSAVRDWFRVNKQITLKNYPRGMEWWNQGQDLYSSQFEDAGFKEISMDDVTPGDCALMHIHSKGVICHAAVVQDSATLFHHTYSRSGSALSGAIPMARWRKHIVKFVRYSV